MSHKHLALSDELHRYALDTGVRESAQRTALRRETAGLEMARMQISPDQGQFMAFLVKMLDARLIVEVGTFTGYSALAMAEASAPEARIICCDVSEEWTTVAQRHWQAAGLAHKLDLRLAPALETLAELATTARGTCDFAFIDADKPNYGAYYEACLGLLRPGGIVAVDNVFWGGAVVDPADQAEETRAIRELSAKMHGDDRVDLSVVPIGDGLALARKK